MTDTRPWLDCDVARLRALWVEVPRLSRSQIGERMGRSKNSIIGKATRLDLPPRTPVEERRAAERKPRPPRPSRDLPATGATLPALPSLPEVEEPVDPAPAPPEGRITPCCWVKDDTVRFRPVYCDMPSVPNRPWCADHIRVVYARKRVEVAEA